MTDKPHSELVMPKTSITIRKPPTGLKINKDNLAHSTHFLHKNLPNTTQS